MTTIPHRHLVEALRTLAAKAEKGDGDWITYAFLRTWAEPSENFVEPLHKDDEGLPLLEEGDLDDLVDTIKDNADFRDKLQEAFDFARENAPKAPTTEGEG